MQELKLVVNSNRIMTPSVGTHPFSVDRLCEVIGLHKSIPGYMPTPVYSMSGLAARLGVRELYVKDEAPRFGLNAFKALGASYAISRFLAQQLGVELREMSFDGLKSLSRERLGRITFTTATDGNHGRAVAWAARELGHESVVYLPRGASQHRLQAIAAEGAHASITDLNYDDAVRLANQQAQAHGWQVVQDTAWPGYEEIPLWVMQGYSTIISELADQMAGLPLPTHAILQAGVGSFAGAVQAALIERYGYKAPAVVVVEPHNAACLYRSAQVGDGRPHAVAGDLDTIMAGLSCGEPNPLGWEILRRYALAFVSCSDDVAIRGMRLLAGTAGPDRSIVSGESGAVGVGLLAEIMGDREHGLRQRLGISHESIFLCINTEGDTDPDSYSRIIGRTR